MTMTPKERDWLETLKRQTQRDVESGRLDAIEAARLRAMRDAMINAYRQPPRFDSPR